MSRKIKEPLMNESNMEWAKNEMSPKWNEPKVEWAELGIAIYLRGSHLFYLFSVTTVFALFSGTSMRCSSLWDSFLSSLALENILLSFLNFSSFCSWLLSLTARISFPCWSKEIHSCPLAGKGLKSFTGSKSKCFHRFQRWLQDALWPY